MYWLDNWCTLFYYVAGGKVIDGWLFLSTYWLAISCIKYSSHFHCSCKRWFWTEKLPLHFVACHFQLELVTTFNYKYDVQSETTIRILKNYYIYYFYLFPYNYTIKILTMKYWSRNKCWTSVTSRNILSSGYIVQNKIKNSANLQSKIVLNLIIFHFIFSIN